LDTQALERQPSVNGLQITRGIAKADGQDSPPSFLIGYISIY